MSKKTKSPSSVSSFFNSSLDEEMIEEDDSIETDVNFEKASNSEISEYMLEIREATKNTQKSLENQWNTDYYFCAFFADQEQRDEFLKKCSALGLMKDNFINGVKLAECLGIDLIEKEIDRPKLFPSKKDWLNITMD